MVEHLRRTAWELKAPSGGEIRLRRSESGLDYRGVGSYYWYVANVRR